MRLAELQRDRIRSANRVVVCAIAGLGVVASLSGCQRAPKEKSKPGPVSNIEQRGPRLKIEHARVDFDPMVLYEGAHRSVAFSNEGALPLEITSVERSRFCSGRAEPTTLGPHSSGRLELVCNSDLYGPMLEHVFVRTNDPQASKVTLDLAANVIPILAFDKQSISLEMPFGEQRIEEVRIIGTMAVRAKVKLKSEAIADVGLEPLPATEGKTRGFAIRCKGRKPGMNSSNLIISTDLERPREVAIPYVCKVIGTLEFTPTNPYFNLKVSGPKFVFVDVRSSQPNFEVQAVHIAEGPFAATFEHAPDGPYFRVKVTVLDEQIDDETRGVNGRLIVISNDRTEPQKEISLFGLGRVNRATPLEP